jgi:putative AdoMet-dependent methyltransferase
VLSKEGFDLWANDYDKTVQVSEENNKYPFAGYKQILNTIYNAVMQKQDSKVLDIGFGTGILTKKLYENGHRIDGLDFSPNMISIAKSKMHKANLIEWDISNGLPPEILGKKYDFIVSTYTLHHLTDEEKIAFIVKLLCLIEEDGKIFIGDISFETREKLEICQQDNLSHWDSNEFYSVYDEIKSSLKNKCNCEFHQISYCGAVIVIYK